MLTSLLLGWAMLHTDFDKGQNKPKPPAKQQKKISSEPTKAIDKELDKLLSDEDSTFDQLLALSAKAKKVGDLAGMCMIDSIIADFYNKALETDMALAVVKKSIETAKLYPELEVHLASLESQWGEALRISSKPKEAAPHYLKSAGIFERKGKIVEAVGQYNNAAFCYQTVGTFTTSIQLFEKSVKLLGKTNAPSLKATILNNIALGHISVREYDEALTKLEQAQEVAPAEEVALHALIFNNFAFCYQQQEDLKSALLFYEQAFELYKKLDDARGLALCCLNIGTLLNKLDEPKDARELFETALPIYQELKDEQMTAIIVTHIGQLDLDSGNYSAAMTSFAKALQTYQQTGWTAGQAVCLSSLAEAASSLGNDSLGIALLKQSVNLIQGYRKEMNTLPVQMRETIKGQFEGIYRMLADKLVSEGRLAEAEQVVNMLKDEELYQYIQRGDEKGLDTRSELTTLEKEWDKKYRDLAGRVLEASKTFEVLNAKSPRTPDEDKKLADAQKIIEDSNAMIQKFLDDMSASLKAANKDSNRINDLKDDEGLVSDLAQLSTDSVRTAAITTILTDEACSVILTSPEGRTYGTTKIPRAELNKKIQTFRTALQNENLDPRQAGKALYDLLIQPIEKELAAADVKSIIWSLDGSLRYVPISALYDGERYLIEKYQVSIFTPASRSRLSASPIDTWKAASFGNSKAHLGFSALPGVPEELAAIQKVVPSTSFLDGAFTKASFLKAMQTRQYSVVHVASHFSLVPGQDATSFLLLGDGTKLPLSDVAGLPSRSFDGVDLMTLSACQTAIGGGDGTELEGFAAIAQRKGVKAVMASLWPIDDAGTRLLMESFYGTHQATKGQTKSESLRQAQLSLLNGTAKGTPGVHRGDPVEAADDNTIPKFTKDPAKPFAHPYFWAPFVLIGNFR